MSEAIRLGMSRRKLYEMRDAGVLEMVARGLYRLRELPALASPDLVTIAKRIPQGVVCLISALASTSSPRRSHTRFTWRW